MQSTSAVTPNIHQDLWISRVKSLPYRNIHTAGPENETQDGHVASVVSISFTSDDQHVFCAPGLEYRIVVVWDICTRRMKIGSFRGNMQMSPVYPHCSSEIHVYTFASFSYSSSSVFGALILNPQNIRGSYSQDLSVHLHLHIAVIPLQPSSWSHINFKPNIPRSAEGEMCALPSSVYIY